MITYRRVLAGRKLSINQWVSLSVALALLVCVRAEALSNNDPTVAGFIIVASGEVVAIRRHAKERVLKRRSKVFEGDTLVTGPSGRAQVKFKDGGVIALNEDTSLMINQFRYKEGETGGQRSFFTLVKGGFRAISGVIGKQSSADYRVDTPLATIGIRGTHYEAILTDSLGVAVWDGSVSIENDGGILDIGVNDDYRFAMVTQATKIPEGWLIPPMGVRGVHVAQLRAPKVASEKQMPRREAREDGVGEMGNLMGDQHQSVKPLGHHSPEPEFVKPTRQGFDGGDGPEHHHPDGIHPIIDEIVDSVGIDANQDFRLTTQEANSLDRVGVLTIDRETQWANGIFVGKANGPLNGDFIFKDFDASNANVVIRRRDVFPVYFSAMVGGKSVDWGVWNASVGDSAAAYFDASSGTASVGVVDPVTWVVGSATDASAIASEVSLSNYNTVVAFQGFESGVALSTPGVAYIDMDFATGNFTAQLNYTGTGVWNMSYSGVGVDSKLSGTGTGSYNGGLGLQAASGEINGVLIGNTPEGVMGGFKNEVVSNPAIHSSGTFVIQR